MKPLIALMSQPTFGESHRLELVVHHALKDAKSQMKKLKGKNKTALQQELMEWKTVDFDELDISYADHFNYW